MRMFKKILIFLFVFVSLGVITFHLAHNYVFELSVARYKLIQLKAELTSDREKYFILFWTKFFKIPYWNMGNETNGPEYLESINCPVKNCIFTHNKDLISPIIYYDAIIFHAAENWGMMDLPKMRSTHQLYVMATMESPAETKHNLQLDDEFYNLTMTYRLDSDIIWSYGKIVDMSTNQIVAPSRNVVWREPSLADVDDKSLHSIFERKSKAAAWFVSHCNVFSERDELAASLQQYIDIDIYGKCGTLSCPIEKSRKCNEKLNSTYKFYLSFENALCGDYVTEKLFKVMDNYIIPIVFNGAANMNHFLPPRSFINANDFKTVEQLGLFLRNLMRNRDEYLSYFWWKKFYRIDFNLNQNALCDLCKKLNEGNVNDKVQYYKSISNWWTKDVCINPKIKF